LTISCGCSSPARAAVGGIGRDCFRQAKLGAFEQARPSPLALKRRPRLRRLVPDTQLLRRRAAGQPVRALASDYNVAHTTLSRYFARPEVKQ